MASTNELFKQIPAVDKMLVNHQIQQKVEAYGREVVVFAIQETLKKVRAEAQEKQQVPDNEKIICQALDAIDRLTLSSFKSIINTTGIVIHTNLGRSPLGKELIDEAFKPITKYNNLEFDLDKAGRGHRDSHCSPILKYLTGAEDVVVVNNNAAALMLILRTFAKNKEVIVSRGELVEIGGSFRVPDIMKASDCKMVEVGTTNKTKYTDYKEHITDETALLLKTHKSNYAIKGFTKEVSLQELSTLGKAHQIPVVFDIGSGMIQKPNHPALKDEPDVKTALQSGADLLCFSGDKLLGGPQSGIIIGKKHLIEKIRKEPMMRALRVGKTTLSLLETAVRFYLKEEHLFKHNLFFKTIMQTENQIKERANCLINKLQDKGISASLSESQGQFGGGTLPDESIPSFAVKLNIDKPNRERSKIAKTLYHQLLKGETPVLSILKGANIYWDMLCVEDKELDALANSITSILKEPSF